MAVMTSPGTHSSVRIIIRVWGRAPLILRRSSTSSRARVVRPVITRSNGVMLASESASWLSAAGWMLQPSLANSPLSSSSTSLPDGTTNAIFCASASLHGLAIRRLHVYYRHLGRLFSRPTRRELAPQPETRESLGFILKAGNDLD